MKRRLLVVVAILTVIAPAQALATDCMTADIDHVSYTVDGHEVSAAHLGSWAGTVDGSMRSDLVGSYLWVQYDDGEIVSIEIADDVTGVAVCSDGTVELRRAQPTSNSAAQPATADDQPTIVDIAGMYDLPVVRDRPLPI